MTSRLSWQADEVAHAGRAQRHLEAGQGLGLVVDQQDRAVAGRWFRSWRCSFHGRRTPAAPRRGEA
ncbi:MAG: hypothetical protein MZU95_10905 [Desulfomicrobium escambiense]|nr:hypothetical protein [Desulfomicrobium escambiense]